MILLSRLLQALEQGEILTLNASLDTPVEALRTDSSAVCQNDLFFAVRGRNDDGHRYISDARKRGAGCIVFDDPAYLDACRGTPFVLCRDARTAAARMAFCAAGNPERKLNVIGVTGTNGKTSTVTILSEVLNRCGLPCALLGTVCGEIGKRRYYRHMTTPDPLFLASFFREAADAGYRYLAMEVSSHALAQSRVCAVPFALGVFTGLGRDHLDYHHTVEAYFGEKRKLLLQSRRGLVRSDCPYGKRLLGDPALSGRLSSFSLSDPDADYGASDIRAGGSLFFTYRSTGMTVPVHSPLIGAYQAANLTAAIAAGEMSGIPTQKAVDAACRVAVIPGRTERVPLPVPFTALIDFAHTPDALRAACQAARGIAGQRGKVLIVFGCGGERDEGKRQLMGAAASKGADRIYLTEDNSRGEDTEKILAQIRAGITNGKPVFSIPQRREAIAAAFRDAGVGDVLLLCGKGHETTIENSTGTAPFSEKEILYALCDGSACENNV